MKIKYQLFPLFIFLLCLNASAQEVFNFNSNGGGFNILLGNQSFDASPYFGLGRTGLGSAISVDTISLTKRITSVASFNKPTGNLTNIGFQGYGLFNSIIMGGELNVSFGKATSGIQSRTDSNNQNLAKYGTTSAQAVGSNVIFNLGMVAIRKRGFIAYPLIGVGFGLSGIRLKASEDERVYPQLTGVITARNQENMLIWTSNAVLDFGLGAQYLFGKSTEDNAKGFSLGFRLGYYTQLASDGIKVNGLKNAIDNPSWKENKPNLPSIGASGFYAKVLIGFGRISSNR